MLAKVVEYFVQAPHKIEEDRRKIQVVIGECDELLTKTIFLIAN